jgi:hypothetical protein
MPAYEQTSLSVRSYYESQKAAAELLEREQREAETRRLQEQRRKELIIKTYL